MSNPIALTTHLQRIRMNETRELRANDTDRYVLTAQPGKSQGRPLRKHGLEAHRQNRPAQHAFSQGPWPSHPSLNPNRPDQQPQHDILMPRETAAWEVAVTRSAWWLTCDALTAYRLTVLVTPDTITGNLRPLALKRSRRLLAGAHAAPHAAAG